MRVRILSGNQAGSIVDVGPEGAIMLRNGFAELAPETPADAVHVLASADPVAPVAEGASLAEPDESDDVSKDPDPVGVPAARVRKPRTKTAPAPATRRRKRR
jgi:hypothetical protein